MKKIFLTFIVLSLLLPNLALGQTPTEDEAQSEPTAAKDKIDQIKDKVTNKVEKLNLVGKRGLVGIVESVSDTQIKINDLNDKIRIIEVDELTKYSSDENNSFDLSGIEKGVSISAIGLYNKESEKLLARFVKEVSLPVLLNGVITNVDSDNYTITLSTEDEKNYTVDIENITKTFSFSDEDLTKAGFSDLETLQNAVVTGFPDSTGENRITATRIIVFPGVPKNPRVRVQEPTKTKETSSSPTPEK